MNIILINHYAGSPFMGMEFRPYYLAKIWSKLGHKTTIIAGSYSHVRQKQPSKRGLQNIEGVEYLFLWNNHYVGNGIKRLLSMIIFITQIFLRAPFLAFSLKPKVVIASSTYPIDIFSAWLIAKFSRAKLVFEIHDLWPLSPMEIGGMSKYHPFIMLMRFGEWFAYKFSDKIVSILPCVFEHLEKDGVKRQNFLHVPNGIMLDDFKPNNFRPDDFNIKGNRELSPQTLNILSFIKKQKAIGNLLIAYSGAIGAANDLDNILQAALLLKGQQVSFIIIGDGPKLAGLKKFSLTHKLDNVIFFNRIERKQLLKVLAKVDVLYIGLKKQPLFRFGISPNKIYDYMLTGKPIIQAIDAGNNPVIEAKCGFSIPAGNPTALVEVIKKIMQISENSKETLEKLGENGKKYVMKHHDYNVIAKTFLSFIYTRFS